MTDMWLLRLCVVAYLTAVVIFCAVIVPNALDREAYRKQVVCEWAVDKGYHDRPCDFWEGSRP